MSVLVEHDGAGNAPNDLDRSLVSRTVHPTAAARCRQRMAAEDARLQGVAAERMLVALKREWAALEQVRAMSPFDTRDLLARLVTLSIRAHYVHYQPARLRRGADASHVPRPASTRTTA
jgi:hypothetical protein